MDKVSFKKKAGIFIDAAMYALLLIQMLYIFTGNTLHEILGIAFFACLVIHCIQKRRWLPSLIKKKSSKPSKERVVFNIVTVLLLLSIIAMVFSSMGVSRLLFPWFTALGFVDLHRYLATAVLTLGVVHGAMHGIMRTKKKKRAVILTVIAAGAALAIGLALVPYMNRHLKKVEISYADAVTGEKAEWKGGKALVVYFTRLGNTDFEEGIDAVSGASLLKADGELMGSCELISDMLCDISGLEARAVTLTGEKYPSSYSDTVSVAGSEKNSSARPDIEKIDVSGYDEVILIYPLWWGDIPMPVATFLESNDLSGKKLHLIATQGSSGFGSSTETVKNLAKGAQVEEVMSIYCEDIPKCRPALLEWVKQQK
ncbi:MAG: hypothetical protein IJM75_07445 [Ruminococcus sp.]|nr:hypothetical protein [Ruminococcus sp.]